jgi:serine/threonine protein kinase
MQNYVGQQIDRYRVTERLGMGGMAVVYKAYDTRLERDVAIKIIRTDEIPLSQHERLLKRFEREAKSQARFTHRNIVPIYDYGDVGGAPYLVMSYIPGGTLKLRTGQPVPYPQALGWLIPIADALHYAHQRGVIHRDIKPSNILFDSEDQPVLTDFGIAKLLETDEATLTGTGLGVGTPEYMAPEQWQGKATPATDQYALGVVLYELLTGQKPYTADTPAAIILMQANEPLRRPSTLAPGIPESLEKLLFKALANNPQDRYEDMAAMRKALERQLTVTPADAIEPAATGKPVPGPVPPGPRPVSGSEAETVDILEPTPAEMPKLSADRPKTAARDLKVSQKQAVFPGWALWTAGAILLIFTLIAGIALLGRDLGRVPAATAEPTQAALALDDTPMPNNTESPAPMVTNTQSPSPTHTSTIIPTATTTEIVLKAQVIVENALLRSGPDFSHPIISERLAQYLNLIVISKSPSEYWFLVKTEDGLNGWLFTDWIELDVPIDLIPIEQFIPTPPIINAATPPPIQYPDPPPQYP